MQSAWRPVSRKYSPIVTPVYGAMNWSGAVSLAPATTTVVYSMAPCWFELVDDLRDRRLLLADGDVEAENALALLVDDRVDRDGGLAGLAVADDELALAAADRDHRVDGLDARLQRLFDRLAADDAGRLDLDAAAVRRLDRALAVDRLAERVDDAADDGLADRHVHDAAGALDGVALFDAAWCRRRAATPTLSCSRFSTRPKRLPGKLDELAGHGAFEAVDAGDAVADARAPCPSR